MLGVSGDLGVLAGEAAGYESWLQSEGSQVSRLLRVAARDAWEWFDELQAAGGPHLTTLGHIKVKHEAAEFADEPSLEEAADVVISLIGALHHRGWTLTDLSKAILLKMTVNRQRTWFQKPDGTFQHR